MKADPVEAGIGQESLEFSRVISMDDLNPGVIERRFSADETECAALAARFGVTALRNVLATVVLRRKARGDLVVLEGDLTAEVEQPCVVTLEAVNESVNESFVLRFTLDSAKAELDVTIDPEADDPPEAVGPEGIDVGEVIAQQLSVAINPYPRAPDVEMEEVVLSSAPKGAGETKTDEKNEKPAGPNPFAVLETLKSGKEDNDR
ncbi:DUF177 domain-containing protein [Pelagibius sp. Alg239-R121]|uniref:YceD family protein n=1 Tax=Pelagibius sp. Alg239-R121 TaxID=2993448 RepID=UPI0024A796F6|nr:DUF177 domain-containing protein [Pelagibius sp. Alg239-R121]